MVAFQALFAGGQGEEGFYKPLLSFAVEEQFLACRTQTGRGGARVGQGQLEQCALQRDRRAQLVRRIGDEPALWFEGRFQTVEQAIECAAELLELVVGAIECQPFVEVIG